MNSWTATVLFGASVTYDGTSLRRFRRSLDCHRIGKTNETNLLGPDGGFMEDLARNLMYRGTKEEGSERQGEGNKASL